MERALSTPSTSSRRRCLPFACSPLIVCWSFLHPLGSCRVPPCPYFLPLGDRFPVRWATAKRPTNDHPRSSGHQTGSTWPTNEQTATKRQTNAQRTSKRPQNGKNTHSGRASGTAIGRAIDQQTANGRASGHQTATNTTGYFALLHRATHTVFRRTAGLAKLGIRILHLLLWDFRASRRHAPCRAACAASSEPEALRFGPLLGKTAAAPIYSLSVQ